MGSATFLDAFDALSLAFVMPILVRMWSLSSVEIGWLIAASYIGQLVGALLFSRLAERYGRVPSAAAATAIMSVMSLGCAWWEILGGYSFAAWYRALGWEAKCRSRRLYQRVVTGPGPGPLLFAVRDHLPGGTHGDPPDRHIAGAATGLEDIVPDRWHSRTDSAGLVARLPESPRLADFAWPAEGGRGGDRLGGSQRRSQDPSFKPKGWSDKGWSDKGSSEAYSELPRPAAETPAVTGRGNRWRELLSPVYRRRTLILWTLWASAFFVANSLNNWMPTPYHEVYGLDLRNALRAASMTNVAQVVMLILCAFTIDRIGRRNWTVGSFIVGALLLGTLAAGGTKDLTLMMLLATLAYGVIGSINAVLYLYTPEVYPTRMRAIGTGLATSWLRLASAVGPALVGTLAEPAGYRRRLRDVHVRGPDRWCGRGVNDRDA